MSGATMMHKTTTLEKQIAAPRAKVFAAWADTNQRAKWNSPSADIEIKMDAADFSEGGRDVSLCIAEGDVVARVIADYHDIVPDQRIIFTETINSPDSREGASLVSVNFEDADGGTKLTVTLQAVALDGSALLEEVVYGWEAALTRLSELA